MTLGSTVQIINAKVEMFNLYDRENESKRLKLSNYSVNWL
jgi:hypothetical protein